MSIEQSISGGLSKVCHCFRIELNHTAFDLWYEALQHAHHESIDKAFDAAIRTCKFPPTIADVLSFLPSRLQHPLPERAYALMPKNEHDGGYVTEQMVTAWCDAREANDGIQARLAFIESYKQIIRSCDANNIPARFYYSAPCSTHGEAARQMKIDATVKAHNDGLISMKKAVGVILDCKRIDDPCYYEENTLQTCRVLTGARSPVVRGLIKDIERDETLMLESRNNAIETAH